MPDENDVVRVLSAHGVELESRGHVLVGRCPLHEPSDNHVLTVDASANTWTCPSCSPSPASVVEFVMKHGGVSRHHALELLRDGAQNAPLAKRGRQTGAVPKAGSIRTLSAPFAVDDTDDVVLTKVAAYYHSRLGQNSEALAYLEARRLRHSRLADRFKLGVADRTLGLRLPTARRKLGAELRARLQRIGLIRDSGHEHMNGCLVVPLFDSSGRVTNLYGRKTGSHLRDGTELHVWLRAGKRGVFNVGGLDGAATVVIAQSIVDALTLWSFDIEHVTAIHGLDGPRDPLLAVLSVVKPKKIIFVLRRLPAADTLIANFTPPLLSFGAEVFKSVLPANVDLNEVAVADHDPREALHRIVRGAIWVAGSTTPNVSTTAMSAPPRAELHETVFTFDDRRWRVRGSDDNTTPGTMRVNVFVSREDVGFHVDVFDIYSSRHRTAFIQQAGVEMGVDEGAVKKDLGRVLLALEQAQEAMLADRRAPEAKPAMTDVEREAALELLRDPRLVDRIANDFERTGVVGERDNLLTAYLVTVSRLLHQPLAALVQSSSAAGKSAILSAALAFVPDESKRVYSAMTGQSLFYFGAASLKHKVLAIAEELGIRRAAYALKLLQSDGALTISSTTKDAGGRRNGVVGEGR